jgi:CRP-like cAMP-binding protein
MLDGKAYQGVGHGAVPGLDRSLLPSIDLFQGLRPDQINVIENACRYGRFAAQELIVDRDSPSNDVFFVVRGCVRIINYSVAGREVAFDDLREGCYFGELSAIDNQPRSASVLALTDTLIVALPGRAFLELLVLHASVAMKVMQRLTRIIRIGNERIMDLSTLAAYSRVQAEVLRQACAHKVGANAAVIDPIPIHSDIASRASTTRETVARVLNDLSRKGVVRRTREGLVISDLRLLREMVDEVRG